MNNDLKIATFANGCFWCTEAVFLRLNGVQDVKSGYTGGKIKNPPYREVAMGRTGHAEGIQFKYNPEQISYPDLLEIFFATHDPTTLNRQGNDVGTQYRSAIYYADEEQKEIAEAFIKRLDEQKVFDNPIVTEVTELGAFYPAEAEHDKFYDRNREQMYCQYIIDPKINKLTTHFKDRLKPLSN